MARELRRLGTEEPSASAGEAAAHMAQAEQQLEQRLTSETQAEQGQAVEKLNRAQAALRQAKREAASQLAQQSAVRIADEIAGLVARQKNVLDETKRLDAERTQQSHWTRGQLRSVQTIAQQERQLQEETSRIAERLMPAEAYAFVLRRGVEEIQAAADRLGQRLTDAKNRLARKRGVVAAAECRPGPQGRSQVARVPAARAQGAGQRGPRSGTEFRTPRAHRGTASTFEDRPARFAASHRRSRPAAQRRGTERPGRIDGRAPTSLARAGRTRRTDRAAGRPVL